MTLKQVMVNPMAPEPQFKAASPKQLLIAFKILNWLGGFPLEVDPRTNLMIASSVGFWKCLIITVLLPGLPIALKIWLGMKQNITLEMLT